ncbi:MAG: hypothetical protein QOF13_2243 [Solirubrobacterales bacterium]|jgi:hypothetical protein|nr:hypothetical protein [Solirubrobacterales bacterium]
MKVSQGWGRAVTGLRAALALAVGCLLLWAPAASAAPPANDDFANREMLSGSLPLEVSRSNTSATKESEEFLGSLFSAGHSVWFEWEATSDGWVTVGGCKADFADVVGVYTGTAVNALTRVASGNASEGPHCPFGQREYTFEVTSGMKYEIVVDGNPLGGPEGPPPLTEGAFELRVEATPPPANDDFANATPIATQLQEEFEGEAFYFGSEFGSNWSATEESGEPDLVGGPSGASVWYSWTAPVSGEARIAGCCGPGMRLGIYTGSSLEALQLLFGGIGQGGFATFMVSAGTTYRIVAYGLIDESSGEAAMSSFQVNISMRARVPVHSGGGEAEAAPRAADTTPPDTKIFKRVLKRLPPVWVFKFHSSEPGSTFRCKLDKERVAACPSSERFGHLEPGRHKLEVFAIDAAGNKDSTPAVARFRVPEQPKYRPARLRPRISGPRYSGATPALEAGPAERL